MPSPLLPLLPDAVSRLVSPVMPEVVPSLLQALELIATQSPPSTLVVADLVKAISSSRVAVYETTSYILGELAIYSPLALDAVLALSRATDSRVRHNALLCVNEEWPARTVHDVLEQALRDKSSRVRRKAADWTGRLRCKTLLPYLQHAVDIERNAETRDVMIYEIDRLSSAPVLC